MATAKPQLLLTLGKELLNRIEDFRYSNRIPTRSEAIRHLLEDSLKRYEKNEPKVVTNVTKNEPENETNRPTESSDTLIDELYKNIKISEKIIKSQKTKDL